MSIEKIIAQVGHVYSRTGDSCDFGCDESSVPIMIAYVKEYLPRYPFCVVADWVWVDINVESEVLEKFNERDLKPSFIYAHKVIDDEVQRPFEFVRTTYLQDFRENCIFLSRNTAYILQGQGTRVSIDPVVFAAVFS